MSRGSSVEYEAVAQACSKLFLAGESVSLPRVYDAIGNKGSSRVVQDYIKRWRKETADKLAITVQRNLPGVPEGLVAGADEWLVKLWQGALAAAEQTFLRARGELDFERAQIEAEHELLRAANSHLEGDLALTRATLSERDQALGELKGAYQDQAVGLREREAQVTALREEVARLSATLDAIQRQHATDLAAAQIRGEELVAEARRELNKEIEREREAAVGERAYLMRTTDEIRQAARLTEQHLKAESASSKEMAEGYRMRAHRAESDAARWQGRADAAESLLAKLTTKRTKNVPNPAAH